MAVQLSEIVATLEAAYPPALAEPWDTGIGLTCGARDQAVTRVLLAVDADPATVAEAGEVGAQLLVTHHPLLFRPVQSVAADTLKGSLLHRLIRGGIAHFAAHTNADRAVGGVNDALAEALGLVDTSPLVPVDGTPGAGLGRVGSLREPQPLDRFVAAVAAALPPTASGIRAAGSRDRSIRRVAVCGGAGAPELASATRAGADCYVTSDLTHHVAAEHGFDGDHPALVEVAHFAGEWPWLARVAHVIDAAWGGSVEVTVSMRCTDPWTIHRHHPDADRRRS